MQKNKILIAWFLLLLFINVKAHAQFIETSKKGLLDNLSGNYDGKIYQTSTGSTFDIHILLYQSENELSGNIKISSGSISVLYQLSGSFIKPTATKSKPKKGSVPPPASKKIIFKDFALINETGYSQWCKKVYTAEVTIVGGQIQISGTWANDGKYVFSNGILTTTNTPCPPGTFSVISFSEKENKQNASIQIDTMVPNQTQKPNNSGSVSKDATIKKEVTSGALPNATMETEIILINANFTSFSSLATIISSLPDFINMKKSLSHGVGTFTVTHKGDTYKFLTTLNSKLGAKYEVTGFNDGSIEMNAK